MHYLFVSGSPPLLVLSKLPLHSLTCDLVKACWSRHDVKQLSSSCHVLPHIFGFQENLSGMSRFSKCNTKMGYNAVSPCSALLNGMRVCESILIGTSVSS